MLVYSNGSLGIFGYIDTNFQGYIDSSKIACEENLSNPFTKSLPECVFERHVNCMSLMNVPDLL